MKKLLLTLTVILSISVVAFGQTNVAPGDGTLGAAIKAAASGAVLVLQSGGVYTESADTTYFIEGKEITIKAAEGYSVRPVIKNLSCPTGSVTKPTIFRLGPDGGLTLSGITFDGLEPDTTAYRSASSIIAFTRQTGYHAKHLKILGCLLKNTSGNIVQGAGSEFDTSAGGFDATLDTMVVDNSLFTNGNNVFNFKYVSMGDLKATNSTFWNIPGGRAFRIMVPPDPTVLIDHCTFDYIGTSDKCIDTKNNTKAWTIKNCSFSNNNGAASAEIVRIYNSLSVIKNCNFFNTGTANIKLQNGAVSENITTDDPKYKDATNGDFTLAADSPLLGKADDGKAIGDLRWDPTATAISNETDVIPEGFVLYQNYPNPFNPTTSIKFDLPETGFVSLKVFNMLGQEVAVVVNESLNAGSYSIDFNASSLTSGVYLYQINANGMTRTQKMILMK